MLASIFSQKLMFKCTSEAEHTLHKKNYKVISLVVSEINKCGLPL